MWSPKGAALPLVKTADGLETSVSLGSVSYGFRLEQEPGEISYNVLRIDFDRNGVFEPNEARMTTPDSLRGRIWSSFSDIVFWIPVEDPADGTQTRVPYPISAWYVFDPFEPDTDPVLRFSRGGWTEAHVSIDGVPAVVVLAEDKMDGIFDREDQWALALQDSASLVYRYPASKGTDRHNWLGENAYAITSIDPTGLQIEIKRVDPGISRAEELRLEDNLAADREAKRSGSSVTFLRDFSKAETMAREENKRLLIDFETVWCGPCKQMDEWVYTADEIVALAESVVSVKLDGDEQRELVERFQVDGYPTVILLSSDGVELKRASGYQSVADMKALLQ